MSIFLLAIQLANGAKHLHLQLLLIFMAHGAAHQGVQLVFSPSPLPLHPSPLHSLLWQNNQNSREIKASLSFVHIVFFLVFSFSFLFFVCCFPSN